MAWEHVVMVGGAAALRDPYYELAKATRFANYASEGGAAAIEWFPVVMELAVTVREFMRDDWATPGAPADWRNWIRIPSIYGTLPIGLQDVTFCTATVRKKFFQQLSVNSVLRQTVRRFELCLPLNIATDIVPPAGMVPLDAFPPDAVVTGIIDDGLAFANQHFRLPDDKARVEFFWNQDDPLNVNPGLGYGREFRKRVPPGSGIATIDDYLASATHAGLIDEDEVYRLTSLVDYGRSGHKSLARRSAHGTHVMHAACAIDAGVDPETRPIICVQFPSSAVADTSGASAARHILDGLMYILKRSDAIAKKRHCLPLPVVVNVSFGNIAGPHDGSSILETAIDQLIAQRNAVLPVPLAVVLPSGNAHQARCHTTFRLKAAGSQRPLDWCVQPDDATPSLMQIWLPHQGGMPTEPRVAVKITPPGEVSSPWIEVGETHVWESGGDVLCAVTNLGAAQTGSRGLVSIWLAPTVTHHPSRDVAPSGEWRVVVKRRNAGPGYRVHAWIQRDDQPYGYPVRGRQSYFEDAKYERFDPASGRECEADKPSSHVRRDSSMNAFGTGRHAIVIGGFRDSDLAAWKQSAGGPIVKQAGDAVPHRDGPDALAISDDTPGLRGRLAAGTRSGSIVAMNGTSVAAPQVAQWIANEMGLWLATAMLAAPNSDRNAVRTLAQAQEAGPPVRPNPPLPKRGGAGRIKLPPLVNRGIETK